MVSVIIRNKNEQDYIGFAIQSVLDTFINPEIIVVDNNSTDESLKIVSLFDKANIKIINIDSYTPGKSINAGVKAATKKYILILSAHCQITEFDNKVFEYADSYVGVFGQQNPIYRGKKITKRYIWSHFGDSTKTNLYSDIENRWFFHNAFSLFTKENLIKYPMPEQYSGKEDRYWAKDIVKIGKNYLYYSDIKVNHYYTGNGATWKGLG